MINILLTFILKIAIMVSGDIAVSQAHLVFQHGKEYNESPARKLSQSFHLEMVGGKAITTKQTLLGAIDTVMSSHTPLKRSEDSHFKAFISLGLK